MSVVCVIQRLCKVAQGLETEDCEVKVSTPVCECALPRCHPPRPQGSSTLALLVFSQYIFMKVVGLRDLFEFEDLISLPGFAIVGSFFRICYVLIKK